MVKGALSGSATIVKDTTRAVEGTVAKVARALDKTAAKSKATLKKVLAATKKVVAIVKKVLETGTAVAQQILQTLPVPGAAVPSLPSALPDSQSLAAPAASLADLTRLLPNL